MKNACLKLLVFVALALPTAAEAQSEPQAQPALTADAPGAPEETLQSSGRLVKPSLQEIGAHALEGADVAWGALLAAAGLIVVVVALGGLHRWWPHRHDAPPPWSAFLLVTRRLELGWSDRLLLWRISRANGLPTPLTLLMASGTLYHHGRQYTAGFSVERRRSTLRRISAIQRAAFGHTVEPHGDADATDN